MSKILMMFSFFSIVSRRNKRGTENLGENEERNSWKQGTDNKFSQI